jgi:hypothetical protein
VDVTIASQTCGRCVTRVVQVGTANSGSGSSRPQELGSREPQLRNVRRSVSDAVGSVAVRGAEVLAERLDSLHSVMQPISQSIEFGLHHPQLSEGIVERRESCWTIKARCAPRGGRRIPSDDLGMERGSLFHGLDGKLPDQNIPALPVLPDGGSAIAGKTMEQHQLTMDFFKERIATQQPLTETNSVAVITGVPVEQHEMGEIAEKDFPQPFPFNQTPFLVTAIEQVPSVQANGGCQPIDQLSARLDV